MAPLHDAEQRCSVAKPEVRGRGLDEIEREVPED